MARQMKPNATAGGDHRGRRRKHPYPRRGASIAVCRPRAQEAASRDAEARERCRGRGQRHRIGLRPIAKGTSTPSTTSSPRNMWKAFGKLAESPTRRGDRPAEMSAWSLLAGSAPLCAPPVGAAHRRRPRSAAPRWVAFRRPRKDASCRAGRAFLTPVLAGCRPGAGDRDRHGHRHLLWPPVPSPVGVLACVRVGVPVEVLCSPF